MAFALLFNLQDLTPIAAHLGSMNLAEFLTTEEVNFARAIWNAGVNFWDTSPLAPPDMEPGQDPDMRVCVVDGKYKGQTIMAEQAKTLLRSMAQKIPGAAYLRAIADEGSSAWMEPWPPA